MPPLPGTLVTGPRRPARALADSEVAGQTGSNPAQKRKGRALDTFTAAGAAQLGGPEWLQQRRARAFADFEVLPLPSEKEELWRYTPIDELELGGYRPAAGPAGDPIAELMADAFLNDLSEELGERSALVVVRNGAPVSFVRTGLPEPVSLGGLASASGETILGSVVGDGDSLVRLNDAFVPDAVVVDVPPGVLVEEPIVIVHWCDGEVAGAEGAPASFPRTVVRVGRDAQASVVEVVAGAPGSVRALVLPVTELIVENAGVLSYVSLQVLGTGAWHLARLSGQAGRDARLRVFTVGLGGAYDRSRTDCVLLGQGGSSELRSAYLGTGDQIHDIRTLQDHAAPQTTSSLLCKGAVAGTSRSVYSGLIRVRNGAVRTEAMQTNHNLVLDERAHADSVPNLEIEENDVRCSHASTVGPVDEDQLYYLESRGVPPERAEELIVLGFFDDIIDRSPIRSVAGRLRREVRIRLAEALGIGADANG